MTNPSRIAFLLAGRVVAGALALLASVASAAAPIDFNRQVRPLLSENCFACHGPDEAACEKNMRLDRRDDVLRPAKSGALPIVPGKPEESEIFLRITDAHDAMPPAETGKKVMPQQVAILRQWIAEGANYATHWSFVPPVAPTVPGLGESKGARNEIDAFVRARLRQENQRPAREADRATLLRRVAFDLTGLPPAPAALDAFLADTRSDAYERAVDRLLASHHYGERMAADWLDAARYADSNGFFRDDVRQAWPWRDWVIGAFNRNLPFDQFTVEQLAGDLLPSPTVEQRIATGFNRNHSVSGEGGIIDEEYRVEYVADRLETTSTVWLGLTVGCARCHDHKYDPLPQRDYYRLFAFFNSSVEKGQVKEDDPPPVMDVTRPAQQAELDRMVGARKEAEAAFARVTSPLEPRVAEWEAGAAGELRSPADKLVAHVDFEAEPKSGATLPRAVEKGGVYYESGVLGRAARFDGMQHFELPADVAIESDAPWTIGLWIKPSGPLSCVISKVEPSGDRRGFEIINRKGQLLINLIDRWVVSAIEVITLAPLKREWAQVVVSYDGSRRAAGLKVYIDGQEAAFNVIRDSLQGAIANREPVRIGRRDAGLGFNGELDEVRILHRATTAREARAWYWSDRLQGVLAVAPAKRTAPQKKLLMGYYVERHADDGAREAQRVAAEARAAEEAFRVRLPKTLVMHEVGTPRPTHVLKRGQYDALGEKVTPGVPEALPPLAADLPSNRLGLARWLTSPNHPLTARVAVNRLWHQCFGEGLVSTLNDFGSQGEVPSHPELLDWLATRFVASGWDMKAMLRLIVTSATYRQSSVPPSPQWVERDPANRLLAHGPRFRLSGEMIRDQALAASGLLIDRVGGPPVKPYQPPGLWEAVSYDGELTYEVDRGEGLWRRTVYSHWKRTSPPPGVLMFDGPTRDICVVRRPRTNTPLQALMLLNDETYVEAARALAAEELQRRDASAEERLAGMFRRALGRPANAAELSALRDLHRWQRERFAARPDAARALLNVGFSPRGRELDPTELAALTVAGQTLFNLDEFVTRR